MDVGRRERDGVMSGFVLFLARRESVLALKLVYRERSRAQGVCVCNSIPGAMEPVVDGRHGLICFAFVLV